MIIGIEMNNLEIMALRAVLEYAENDIMDVGWFEGSTNQLKIIHKIFDLIGR